MIGEKREKFHLDDSSSLLSLPQHDQVVSVGGGGDAVDGIFTITIQMSCV
jgi:hypothetical protein